MSYSSDLDPIDPSDSIVPVDFIGPSDPINLINLINQYAKNSGSKPFLEHIDYFQNSEGKINRTSIATNWSNLSKENYLKTLVKAEITISGANYVNQKKNSGCPWKYDFNSSAEIMPHLKHSRDSDVVNYDGSINVKKLEQFMLASFEYDNQRSCFFVRKSRIIDLLRKWKERDAHLEHKVHFMMPAWETVAKAEWDDFYLNFTDHWDLNNKSNEYEPTVTADTFLQFYFQGKKLYDRVLVTKELPAVNPLKCN
ncbi:MAG: hypothetical protein Terrestrivirus10_11 [Terrestrivirus sp.]|uniref:Uncharacterized protein n=1 Tax=Terrestrivirus sp. TaxID=2487775 RepID=A0A3G4ZP22_9VIRU|nr:MAG: hypothetical protein Terrestrivirus10_11 [Terrestrivirus sp.]